MSHESKRNQIARIVVGAVAAGCERIPVPWEPRRLAISAVEHLQIGAKIEEVRTPITHSAQDTQAAVLAMREQGCRVLVVLGGDGTSRAVTKAWPDAVLMPLSTGTNNVFPLWIEPTIAGLAAGLIAAGRIAPDGVAPVPRSSISILKARRPTWRWSMRCFYKATGSAISGRSSLSS
ncbi:MAG: NAD(+)/NADH kinase [Gammaproteobacteria bacterium]|nr:NAD(+)/NADH kinase [Gammaproteobacteria bacterium]